MRFYIDKLLLWLKDGNLRTLKFQNDKINVITGNSKTGKTAILEIIDYCLCGSNETVVISREHIGENVAWYGIRFCINDKTYTIARGEISDTGKFSNDYYFSQTGEIPESPFTKIGEQALKEIIEPEFSINDEITLSYGGRSTKRNSRLSFRYFLLLNTLSKDVIDNGKAFFDKMYIERYRDVWPQIFDLAFGVIDFETVKVQKEISELQQEIYTLEQNRKKAERRAATRDEHIEIIVKHAKEFGLVDEALSTVDAYGKIEQLIKYGPMMFATNYSLEQESERLQAERDDIAVQLAKLKRFKRSYSEYRAGLRAEADALQPITYIQRFFTERTSGEYRQFLNNLSSELAKIKSSIIENRPFEQDVNRKIRELSNQLKEIDSKLAKTAKVEYKSIPIANKLISLGEIKAEFSHIEPYDDSTITIAKNMQVKMHQLERLEASYASVGETRALTIETLDDFIQTYITISRDALDEYGDYCARFDYKKAALTLRKNKSTAIANISSSSDHLYMHLCLFAGLHHMLLSQKSLYVPSFLILDQPSRPYFNAAGEYDYTESEAVITNKDDWSKVRDIFKLWNNFFSIILSQGNHFQIIMLEHVSEGAWHGCEHVNLVEVFDGIHNALIPLDLPSEQDSK